MDMLIFNARTFELWNKQLLEFPPFSIPQQNVINDGLPVRSTCMAKNIARKRRQHTWNWARSCWYLWVVSEVRWFLLSSHIASPQDCEPLHHTFFDCNDYIIFMMVKQIKTALFLHRKTILNVFFLQIFLVLRYFH